MIVVDSSAVIAIFRQEEDAEVYAGSIAADDEPVMSAANLVDVSIVLRGLKKIAPESFSILCILKWFFIFLINC